MIEGRVDSREGLCPEDFFVVQRLIWLSELSVSLLRKFSQSLITWQVRLALRLCGLYVSATGELPAQALAESQFLPCPTRRFLRLATRLIVRLERSFAGRSNA